MSDIRGGRSLIERVVGPWCHEDYTCAFCGHPVVNGAEWRGIGSDVALCRECLRHGQLLGALLGDAASHPRDLAAMLEATQRHAWRAYTLAEEQRADEESRRVETRWQCSACGWEEET